MSSLLVESCKTHKTRVRVEDSIFVFNKDRFHNKTLMNMNLNKNFFMMMGIPRLEDPLHEYLRNVENPLKS